MECDICLSEYDQVGRTPKVVPCGHTVCLQCLQQSTRKECPSCRTVFTAAPVCLPNNFSLLRLLERQGDASSRFQRGWCSDCRAAAKLKCWDDHAVLNTKAALRRHLQTGVLQQAAAQLEGLHRQCQEEETLLTLLTAESWDLTLRSGSDVLLGNLANGEDPLITAVWLVLAEKAALTEVPHQVAVEEPRTAAEGQSPHAAQGRSTPAPVPMSSTPLRCMNVKMLNLSGPLEKAATLVDVTGVERLVNVECNRDPDWSLQLLQCAASSLEQLSVFYPQEAHLHALQTMPRLRRLHVSHPGGSANEIVPDALAPVLQALPPGYGGLQWLRAWRLPRPTLQSLLSAHGHSLEYLQLRVDTRSSFITLRQHFWKLKINSSSIVAQLRQSTAASCH